MKLYSGIDLHSNNSVVVLLDEEDQTVYQRRLGNDLQTILAALEPYREKIQGLAVESTYNWYWLVDGLMEAGYQVHLVNTAAVKQYEGMKRSTGSPIARRNSPLLRKKALNHLTVMCNGRPDPAPAMTPPPLLNHLTVMCNGRPDPAPAKRPR